MKDKIEEFLPTTGTIAKFLEYTSGGEICPRFRFFAFAAGIGALVKRQVYHQRSSYALLPTLYPNIWVILVAPQGVGHKSSALSAAIKVIQSLPSESQPRFLASKLTPEALVKALASEIPVGVTDPEMLKYLKRPAQGILFSSELGVLLGKEKYNQGMIALLTDLYDTPDKWHSETIMRGNQFLFDVCLTIMAASTPDWMQTMLPSDAFKGGFMSRQLIVGFPDTWDVNVSDPPPPDEDLKLEILAELGEIIKLEGEMKWTLEAKEFFDYWYLNRRKPEPGPVAAYLERKQNHVLRLAMILELSKAPSLILTKDSIEQALNILSVIEPDTFRMIELISIEPRMRVVQIILEYLEGVGQCTEAELLWNCWKHLNRPAEFNEIIQLLLKTKKVSCALRGQEAIYKIKEKEISI